MGFELALLLALAGTPAHAVPPTLQSTGYLKDAGGAGLTGTQSLTFRLYDDAVGTNILWTETHEVEFSDGAYTVLLGTTAPLTTDVLDLYPLFLGLAVGGNGDLLPRQEVASLPYALLSETAYSVDGGTVDATAVTVGDTVIDSTGIHMGGSTVIDASGSLSGDAAKPADLGCEDGNAMVWDEGSAEWACGITPTISTDQVDDWNTAYQWGNHAAQGYLKVELDQQFRNSPASGIADTDIAFWFASAFGVKNDRSDWDDAHAFLFDDAGNAGVLDGGLELPGGAAITFGSDAILDVASIESWDQAYAERHKQTVWTGSLAPWASADVVHSANSNDVGVTVWQQSAFGSWVLAPLESPTPALDRLRAHYLFEEGSGDTASDSSGGGSAVARAGATTVPFSWGADASHGFIRFETGNTEFLQGPHTDALNLDGSATWVFWIRADTASRFGMLLNKEHSWEFKLYGEPHHFSWAIETEGAGEWAWVHTGYDPPVGQWVHIAVVYDGVTATTYANGTEIHSAAPTADVGPLLTNDNTVLTLGSRELGGEVLTDTSIGQIAIYDVAFTPAQVTEHLQHTHRSGVMTSQPDTNSLRITNASSAAKTLRAVVVHP